MKLKKQMLDGQSIIKEAMVLRGPQGQEGSK
jgi:hypothetical protein